MTRKQLIPIVLCSCALMFFASGCEKIIGPAGEVTYQLDPNAVAQIEKDADAGVGILTILSTIWPEIFVPITTAALAGIAVWKKLKPQIVEAQSEAEIYHTATLCTVTGIEEFKKAYPDQWKNLEAKLIEIRDRLVSPAEQLKIENIILALRGLPPKA